MEGWAAVPHEPDTTTQAWDVPELEIPEEDPQLVGLDFWLPPDLTFEFDTPSSSVTRHERSLPVDDTSEDLRTPNWAEGVINGASLAPDAASSRPQWLCKEPNCGRGFTHRHKLKYAKSPIPKIPHIH